MPEREAHPTFGQRGISFTVVCMLVLSMLMSVVAFGTPSSVSAQAATTAGTTAKLTPATALAYVSVNLDEKSDQWTLSSELLKRAGLTEALAKSGMDTSKLDAEAQSYLGGHAAFVLTTLPAGDNMSLSSITGEVSGAVTDPATVAKGTVPSGFAVIFQNPNPDALQKQFEDMMKKDALNSGSKVTVESHGGVSISVVAPTDASSTGQAIARVGDSVVLATTAKDIFPIIDTSKGDLPNLADDAAFKTLKSGLNTDWLSFGLINGSELLTQLEKLDPKVADQLTNGTIAQLDAITGFTFWADQPGFRLDTLSVPGKNALKADNAVLTGDFAKKVPGDSLFFANGSNINQYGILDTLGLLFAQALVGTGSATPGAATPASLATPATLEESSAHIFQQAASVIGFNIKTDFIDQLTGEFGVAVSASDVTSSSPKISAIIVSDTANATKVTDVASKISFILASSLGDKLSSREVGGASITSIDLSSTGAPLKVEFGVVNGQLLIGTSDGIDSYVNGPTASLADNTVYQDTLAVLPKDATGITFVNVKGLLPLIDGVSSSMTSASATKDNSPDCGKFKSQKDAQAAFDADQFANFDLDRNYNGVACEDFFSTASPEASPVSAASTINIDSVGTVSYVKDGMNATSTIILIGK